MSIEHKQEQIQEVEVTEDAVGPWNEECFEEQYDSGMLCANCHQEEPMYPRKDSDAYCHILCADCYWDEDYRLKHERNIYYALHPEEYEASRKKAAETLGVPYSPLPTEWYQRWVKPVLAENTDQNKIESKSME